MSDVIHFIGGGNMATAIIGGLERLETPPPIVVVDPSEAVRHRHEAAGRETLASIDQLRGASRVVLAFKPQHFMAAAPEVSRALADDAVLISLLVGTSAAKLESALPGGRIVRAMPNTPMMVGRGMTGIAAGTLATDQDLDLAAWLFEASGRVLRVEESRIDDIAAVSGSGPAYFFRFCEALLQAATEQCGFTQDEATLLVSETAAGAMAYLAAQEDFPVARLRQQVTSKGGTTEAALGVMNKADLNGLIASALAAAQARAKELNADE